MFNLPQTISSIYNIIYTLDMNHDTITLHYITSVWCLSNQIRSKREFHDASHLLAKPGSSAWFRAASAECVPQSQCLQWRFHDPFQWIAAAPFSRKSTHFAMMYGLSVISLLYYVNISNHLLGPSTNENNQVTCPSHLCFRPKVWMLWSLCPSLCSVAAPQNPTSKTRTS